MPKVSADHLLARRRQILTGARAAFARHGYEGATVRVLEDGIGLSRGAIFHHFPDKESLFLALAVEDAEEMAATVARQGLVQVMRDLITAPDAGWLGTQLEVSRRLRTDPVFRHGWQSRTEAIAAATRARLIRQRDAGVLRADVEIDVLAGYLALVLEGLVSHLAAGLPVGHLAEVLDLVEGSVRAR
ncbi:TetR/AcrR family transcriptional regulator [Nakamurella flavida]|uniref:TetR/AcrR family transcriptional regulator n=1 Tax=Nakamurella flavida TaxID=363630 RepID=A0A938YCK7_9ACTN|nr:TetR/AcrR family transcriptional regulator [Nakamurella flavida]MBM9475176.1 TetR/AcrR family transcriptional regulator [Nakamurella flavida]MDP9776749.1 AcrR family transcriptional regulator [Nakamurella flavida]